MMKYPIGIQDFVKLRKGEYVYIDKTALIHQLVSTGTYYFLSRPRRFGKSLLMSSIEAYFMGKRELFKGLAMEKLETEWTEYPVLHLDLNTAKYDCVEALTSVLNDVLTYWESLYGTSPTEVTPELRFKGLVRRAYETTGRSVVILVDEYDKPMLQAIGNETLQDEYRNILKAFYSVLKTQDRYIKFAFLTGVTKFGKVSVFSDLNNLEDISMIEAYTSICGITDDELHTVFDAEVAELASKCGLTKAECYDKLRADYDGYHFRQNSEGVYNPFSLLNTLKNRSFGSYWFETGTPSFLVHLLKKSGYNLNDLQSEVVSPDVLNSINSMSNNPIPVIYQSGYLTIKDYDSRFGLYSLGFPNREVEMGFIKYLLPFYTSLGENKSEFTIYQFVKDVENGKLEAFMERLQSMFSDSDYQITGNMEKYFQNSMYLVFKMMGFFTEVERNTSRGRMDILLKTKDYIYILELKLDKSADEALCQINDKGYAEPFKSDGRHIYKIGVNFSTETRSIDGWKIE